MCASWRSVIYAFRILVRNPQFVLVATASLALGIGINTAVFSFADAVLLHPFSYHSPKQLAVAWRGTSIHSPSATFRSEVVLHLGLQTDVFQGASPFLIEPTRVSLGQNGVASAVQEYVGTSLFSILGVSPTLGRSFSTNEEEPGKQNAVILSYGLWQSYYGADPAIVGKSILVNNRLLKVVGVMPRSFFFPDKNVQMWIPLTRNLNLPAELLLRLKPGVSLQRASSTLENIYNNAAETAGTFGKRITIQVFSLYSFVVGNYEQAIWTLYGAVVVLLVIACLNVSGLLLAMGAGRAKELAIRRTFGASQPQLVQQLLIENVLLSLAAGVAGAIFAYAANRFLLTLNLVPIPQFADSTIFNGHVIVYCIGISVLCGLASGAVPALSASRTDLSFVLKLGGGSSESRSTKYVRDILVAAQVSLALVLLVVATMLTSSFIRLTRFNWGFRPENVTMIDVLLPRDMRSQILFGEQFLPKVAGTNEDFVKRQETFAKSVLDRIRSFSNVQSAAVSPGGVPLSYTYWSSPPLSKDGKQILEVDEGLWDVGANYFKTLGIQILEGREFTASDDVSEPHVIVVSESLAHKIWPGQDAVGQRLDIMVKQPRRSTDPRDFHPETQGQATYAGPMVGGTPWQVIGVVGDVKMFGMDRNPEPALYVNNMQWPTADNPELKFLIHYKGRSAALANDVRLAILSVNHNVSITDFTTMAKLVEGSIGGHSSNKVLVFISLMFGGVSIALAASGVYGIVAHSVSQKTREIGIRMALGASPRSIVMLIVLQGMKVVLLGSLIGLAGSLAIAGLLNGFLFHISPRDPVTLLSAAALLVLVGVAACVVPALRAIKMKPIESLRHE